MLGTIIVLGQLGTNLHINCLLQSTVYCRSYSILHLTLIMSMTCTVLTVMVQKVDEDGTVIVPQLNFQLTLENHHLSVAIAN